MVKSNLLPLEQIQALNLDYPDELIAKFHREQYTVGGNDAFDITEIDHFWLILQGRVNLFEIVEEDGKIASARNFMMSLGVGEVIFSLSSLILDKNTKRTHKVIAVPTLDTYIYKAKLDEIGGDEKMFQTLSWVENWVHKLDSALSNFFPARPQSILLEAEADQKINEGDWISGHQKAIVWLRLKEGEAFYGSVDGCRIETSEHPIPLSESSVIYCKTGCVFDGSFSITEHINNKLVDNLRHFNHFLMEALTHSLKEKTRDYARSVIHLRENTEEKASSAIQSVASVYSDVSDYQQREHVGKLPPDIEAWCVALEHLGLEPPRNIIHNQFVEEGRDIFDIVSMCGARYRKIRILEEDWFTRDRGTFISMTIRDKEPVALLPGAGGRYRIVNPTQGTNEYMGLKDSRSIATSGFMLYKPMPEEINGWKDILKFSFQDIMQDFQMVVLIAFIIGLLGMASPYFTGEILSNYLPANDLSLFSWAIIALALTAVARILLGLATTFATMRIIGNMTSTMQSAVWMRMISLPVSFYRNFTAGDLADRANGINSIRETLTQSVFGTILSLLSGSISLAMMLYYSWKMSLFACAMLVVLIGVTFFFTRMQLPHQRKAFMLQGELEGFIYQVLSGIAKIRLLNSENACLQRWANIFKRQKSHQYKAGMWNVIQSVFNTVAVPAMDLALFTFVLFVLLKGEQQPTFGIGSFLAFHVAFGQFSGSVLAVTGAISTVIESVPLYERVRPVLEAKSEYHASKPSVGTLRGKIQLTNVNFTYTQGEALVLQRISFTIEPGEYVAIVGTSGSGKSTLVRLLLGFEKPNSGSVLIDNRDLNDVDIRSIRSQMSTVLQNSSIMQGSIYDNIISGRNHLTLDEVWVACEKAGLKDDIESLPMGLHTVIAEGGIGLSGGQRQRLLIARALISPSSILLFDEATSALDNLTQAVVQKSLNSVNATRVVIAHRLSTVRDVDRILVIDKGQVIEDGGYDELVEQGGMFSELVKRQTFKD